MNKGIHTGMILIDLQKALDTLDYKILIEKMTCLDFKTSVITWFEFNLSRNNIFSEAGILNCDVSEGSGLGTLLFYINDLPLSLSESGSYLYADNTYISIKTKTFTKLKVL